MSLSKYEKKNDNNCITTTIATNIFDAVATLKTGVGFISGVPLSIIQAFDNLLNALNEFATNIVKEDCLPTQEWICFLQCILRSLFSVQASNSTLIGIRAILERITLTIGLVPTSREKEKDCKDKSCAKVCWSIGLVFAAILELIAASLSELSIALGLSTPGGIAFATLATNISQLVMALRNFNRPCDDERACRLYPCILRAVLIRLDLLFANFVASNEVPGGNTLVADTLRRLHTVLLSLAADCLNNLTSQSAKTDSQQLKNAICNLETTINSLVPLSLSPLAPLVLPIELTLLF
jgi:hypothetical protein